MLRIFSFEFCLRQNSTNNYVEFARSANSKLKSRRLFSRARVYSSALPAGGDYIELPRTVIISIINFNLFECGEYHSEFQALETTRHTPLTDKMVLHFYELNKLPKEVTPGDMRLLWLSLFKADTKEELAKIKLMGVPVMEKAIQAYHQITADSQFRELERLREMARHNEASALRFERDEGRKEGRKEEKYEVARNAFIKGFSIDQIHEITGLDAATINSLMKGNS